MVEKSAEHGGAPEAESARFYKRHRERRQVGGREEARGPQVLSKLSSSDLVINNSLKERMEEEKQLWEAGDECD